MQQRCLHKPTKGEQAQAVATQLNSQHNSKLGVTIQEASLSPLPPTPSLNTPEPKTSLHDDSGSIREYCSKEVGLGGCGNNLMTVVFTHKKYELFQLTSDRQKSKTGCLY